MNKNLKTTCEFYLFTLQFHVTHFTLQKESEVASEVSSVSDNGAQGQSRGLFSGRGRGRGGRRGRGKGKSVGGRKGKGKAGGLNPDDALRKMQDTMKVSLLVIHMHCGTHIVIYYVKASMLESISSK